MTHHLLRSDLLRRFMDGSALFRSKPGSLQLHETKFFIRPQEGVFKGKRQREALSTTSPSWHRQKSRHGLLLVPGSAWPPVQGWLRVQGWPEAWPGSGARSYERNKVHRYERNKKLRTVGGHHST